MAETTEVVHSCSECGASIYPEHIARHAAEYVAGKLLCGHCVTLKRGGAGAALSPPPSSADLSLTLPDDPEGAAPEKPRIQTSAPIHRRERTFQRTLLQGVPGATRCRSFHCRINDTAISHMNDQVNEWADAHPDIEIKFAIQVIGAMDGKSLDQQMITTVFY